MLLAIACGGSEGEYSGAEDYALAMCAATETRTTQETATWGELQESMATNLELIGDVSPPPGLQAFHKASVDLMRALAELAAVNSPSDEVPADNVLWGHPELVSLVQTLYETQTALPHEVWVTVTNCP